MPFKQTAVFIVGYKGLVKLILQTGQYEYVDADIIFREDEWEVRRGTEPALVHKPNYEADSYGQMEAVVGVYATSLRKGATKAQFTFVPVKRILTIKAQSAAVRAGGDTPWNHPTNYHWMFLKTGMKQHAKLLEVSSELQAALFLDDQTEIGKSMQDILAELRGEDDRKPAPPPGIPAVERVAKRADVESEPPSSVASPQVPMPTQQSMSSQNQPIGPVHTPQEASIGRGKLFEEPPMKPVVNEASLRREAKSHEWLDYLIPAAQDAQSEKYLLEVQQTFEEAKSELTDNDKLAVAQAIAAARKRLSAQTASF